MRRRLESCFSEGALEETSHFFPPSFHSAWFSAWLDLHLTSARNINIHSGHSLPAAEAIELECKSLPSVISWCVGAFRQAISTTFNIYPFIYGSLAVKSGSGPHSLSWQCWFRKLPSWKSLDCLCIYLTPNGDLLKTWIRYQAQQLLPFFLQ